MKQINTTPFKNLITTLAAIVIVNFSYGKTYTAINSGKWSDAATWDNGTPGSVIATDDQVIIKNHITMNTDVTVDGTLTIAKGVSMMSNKTLLIHSAGKLINNGNLTVKRIINEGTITNNAMMESMNDIENKGGVDNNSNMVAGTNILNFGGNVAGRNGTYFANGTVISSADAKYGNDIKIYANPSQTASTESTMSLEVQPVNGNVMLTVNNPNGESVKKFTIEKSYNGTNYEVVTDVTASNNTIAMIYQDKNVEQETVTYKVKVNDANYLPQATVRMALASASIR
jgi:hypothetical protein